MQTRKSTNPYYACVEEDKNGAEAKTYDSPLQMSMPVTDFLYRTGGSQILLDENPLSSRSNQTTSTAREKLNMLQQQSELDREIRIKEKEEADK